MLCLVVLYLLNNIDYLILFSTTLFTKNHIERCISCIGLYIKHKCFYLSDFIWQRHVLMSDGLSTDRKDAIVEAKLFTMSPYHIIICIGVGARVDHLELIQIASRDDSGIYGPLVFPSSTQDSINMIAKLTMRKDCASKVVIQVNIRYFLAMNNKQYFEIC